MLENFISTVTPGGLVLIVIGVLWLAYVIQEWNKRLMPGDKFTESLKKFLKALLNLRDNT